MEPKADAKEVAAPAAVKSDADAKEDVAPAAVEAEAAADAAAEPPVSEVKAEEGGDPEVKEGSAPEGVAAADAVKPEEATEAAAAAAAAGDKDKETWWRSLETPATDADASAAAMDRAARATADLRVGCQSGWACRAGKRHPRPDPGPGPRPVARRREVLGPGSCPAGARCPVH